MNRIRKQIANRTSTSAVKTLLVLLLISTCFIENAVAQSKVLEEVKSSDKARRGVFLYPSTIRMINLPKLESYYEAIKDIKRANFFPLRNEKFTHHDFLQVRAKLEEEEGYEEYMVVEDEQLRLFVLGRNSGAETVYLSERDGRYYMGQIIGRINVLELASLQRDLTDPELWEANPLLKELLDLGFGGSRHGNGNNSEKEQSIEESEPEKKSKT